MKKVIVVMSFLTLSFSPFYLQALCINCGCEKNYKSCLEEAEQADINGWSENADGSYTYVGSESECKQRRADCHGEGIRIQL